VVADISGRWPAFARFTLHLCTPSATSSRRCGRSCSSTASTRSPGFFEGTEDIAEASTGSTPRPTSIWVDGHSDYGHAFEVFWQRWGKEIGPKTTVLLLATPGNNYHASQAGCSRRCSTGPATSTGSTPSPAATGHRRLDHRRVLHVCDGVFECRNLRQLERFVDNLV
jgi:uncharacterized protein with von Willebrand factor type A (vWA) domain